jgi:hypothetical protein
MILLQGIPPETFKVSFSASCRRAIASSLKIEMPCVKVNGFTGFPAPATGPIGLARLGLSYYMAYSVRLYDRVYVCKGGVCVCVLGGEGRGVGGTLCVWLWCVCVCVCVRVCVLSLFLLLSVSLILSVSLSPPPLTGARATRVEVEVFDLPLSCDASSIFALLQVKSATE